MAKKIALLLGNDFVTSDVMNSVVPALVDAKFEPLLFFPQNKPTRKREAYQPELQEFSFWERGVLNQTIIPFLEKNPAPEGARCITPGQLAKKFNLNAFNGYKPKDVANINDPSFIAELDRMDDLVLAISIRCLQIAHLDLIATMQKPILGTDSRRDIINLHPADATRIRGLLGPAWSKVLGRSGYSVTAHRIVDEGIDTGDFLLSLANPFVPGDTIFKSMSHLPPLMAKVLSRITEDLADGHLMPGHPQLADPEGKNYHSYPNPYAADELEYERAKPQPDLAKIMKLTHEAKDWDMWRQATERENDPLVLVKPCEATDIHVQQFSVAGTAHAKELRARIEEAWSNFVPQPAPADAYPPVRAVNGPVYPPARSRPALPHC